MPKPSGASVRHASGKDDELIEATRPAPPSCRILSGVLIVTAAAGLVPALFVAATLLVLPTMIVATLVGVRVWRPAARLPWYLLAATAGAALLGAILSAPFPNGSVPAELHPLPQYLLAGAALVLLDRARGRGLSRSLVEDAAIVGVSAGLVAFACLVAPVLGKDFTPVARVTRAVYPALDAVLVFLVARLGFGGAWRFSAYRLLLAGFVAAMVADLTWAAFDVGLIGESYGIDRLGLVAYAAFGVAALSRSMADLAAPAPATEASLRSLRLVAVGGSLGLPAVIAVLATADTVVEGAVYACGAIALVALVCWRLMTAVDRHVRSEAQLAHTALHDSLTGLANRAKVAADIDGALARTGGGLAVVLVDLDRFKDLNEGWGHDLGDELLVSVARRLVDVDLGGSSVGRISGDEFVVVCPDVPDRETAATLGQRLLECFRRPFTLSVGEVIVAASAGVAFAEASPGVPGEQLLRDADTAMYRSKEGGGDRVTLFAEPMRAAVRRRHSMEQALRRAIDRHETTMYYQPIVDLQTGQTVGFEALMRWFVEGTSVSPAEFIPIAEETGLIVPLGAQALTDATRFLATCQARHPDRDLSIAVNLSPRQLREPGLLETVRETLAVSGIRPGSLCVEITESAMMESGGVIVDETLASVRQLGVQIAADDFGTGYSALPYLKRFLVGRLKIDLAFVHGLGVSPHDEAVVAGIIAIAESLDLDVVAEGVETQEQVERLQALRCRKVQGWLFAPAMPAEAAAQFLNTPLRLVG